MVDLDCEVATAGGPAGRGHVYGLLLVADHPHRQVSIGGAELAGEAIAAGLVDEIRLLLGPIIVGGGKRALPAGIRVGLELMDERRFASGVVHLHYRLGG